MCGYYDVVLGVLFFEEEIFKCVELGGCEIELFEKGGVVVVELGFLLGGYEFLNFGIVYECYYFGVVGVVGVLIVIGFVVLFDDCGFGRGGWGFGCGSCLEGGEVGFEIGGVVFCGGEFFE